MEINRIVKEYDKKTVKTAMKSELSVEGYITNVIIDTGAAANVITNKLRKKLRVPIIASSNFRCILANGSKVASLGKARISIDIDDELVLPAEVDVIESEYEELIIGNDTLAKVNANINFKQKVLEIENDDELIEIPVEYELPKVKIEDYEYYDEKTDYESEENESEYDEDDEERRKLFTFLEEKEEDEDLN